MPEFVAAWADRDDVSSGLLPAEVIGKIVLNVEEKPGAPPGAPGLEVAAADRPAVVELLRFFAGQGVRDKMLRTQANLEADSDYVHTMNSSLQLIDSLREKSPRCGP